MKNNSKAPLMYCPSYYQIVFNASQDTLTATPDEPILPDYLWSGVWDWAKESSSYKKLVQHVLSKGIRQVDLYPEFISSFKITGVDTGQSFIQLHHSYFEAEMDLINAIKEIDILRISNAKLWSIAFGHFWASYSKEYILNLNCLTNSDFKLTLKLFC